MADFTPRNARPSLPPLHTLGLPYPLVRTEQSASHDAYDSDNDRLVRPFPVESRDLCLIRFPLPVS